MPLKGSPKALGAIARTLQKLSKVPQVVAPIVAQKITALLDDEFDGEHDPYGGAWDKLKQSTLKRWGPHSILDLTGDMRAYTHAREAEKGVEVVIGFPGMIHQTGSKRMVARRVLPNRGLPEAWTDAIRESIAEARK